MSWDDAGNINAVLTSRRRSVSAAGGTVVIRRSVHKRDSADMRRVSSTCREAHLTSDSCSKPEKHRGSGRIRFENLKNLVGRVGSDVGSSKLLRVRLGWVTPSDPAREK